MDILTGFIIIGPDDNENVMNQSNDITLPTDFKLFSYNNDSTATFQYKFNNNIYYIIYKINTKNGLLLFFELVNNVELWDIKYMQPVYIHSSYKPYFEIRFAIVMNIEHIQNNINTSIALYNIISDKYLYESNIKNNTSDILSHSILPSPSSIRLPSTFKLKLYPYQKNSLKKMKAIERGEYEMFINYTYPIVFEQPGVPSNTSCILYNPILNKNITIDNNVNILHLKALSKGGILADEMGLGKTITCIALIMTNPPAPNQPSTIYSTNYKINKINSKATVIICPSHLAKQWASEVLRCNSQCKVLTILTKNDYTNITFNDFINSDIIITTHQFIMNFKFYPTLYYKVCTASSFNFDARDEIIKHYLNTQYAELGFPGINNLKNPIFEFFHFHRIIVDEGHEIFSETIGAISVSLYIGRWITNIDASYNWYISGTPFPNYKSIKNCAKFIKLKLVDETNSLTFDYSNTIPYKTSGPTSFMFKQYIWEQLLNNLCIRHLKSDVESQIKIPGYNECTVWVRMTDIERNIYDAKKGRISDTQLQQLCCHPLVVESAKRMFGNVEIDLTLMQEQLITYHKNNHDTYKIKLDKLDSTRPEYHMLKKTYQSQMSESLYIYTLLEKMNDPEVIEGENCSICIDVLDNPTMTSCGHLFCYNCIKLCLTHRKRCPMCKADLEGKDLMVMNLKKEVDTETNPLILKYGSKLGKLISITRHLVAQDNTRIIIFSQWDDMLTLVGRALIDNGIDNCFVKGNVMMRNAAITKFKAGKNKKGDDNKVIMLCLKNAASGTNLIEATHILFVEPINAPQKEIQIIEHQAIARACRIGQKNPVMVIRILIENTIEEDIYRRNYDNSAVVSFTDPSFMIT